MASCVRFHPCFLDASILSYYICYRHSQKKKKKTYVIGFLATSDNSVPQAQITRYEGQHLMKTSMVMPTDTAGDFVWT